MLVNEAVDAAAKRVATREDIELAMTKGVNYPRGLLSWGDDIGPAAIVAELERLREESGETRYRPSPLLRRCAANGRSLLDVA
jgi:3-hydroxybutyryl-CoA dehydrogenase